MPANDHAAEFVEDIRQGRQPALPAALAEHYRQIITAAGPRYFTAEDADLISYEDARRIRREELALKEALTRVVVEARIAGKPALQIAEDLLLTESYVHKLLRANPWTAVYRVDRQTRSGTWRPLGDEWLGREETRDPAEKIADRVRSRLSSRKTSGDERVRVLVWRDEEGADEDAQFRTDSPPPTDAR